MTWKKVNSRSAKFLAKVIDKDWTRSINKLLVCFVCICILSFKDCASLSAFKEEEYKEGLKDKFWISDAGGA